MAISFKVGDKVKVLRKATTHENGWRNAWVEGMNKRVGQVGVIEKVLVNEKDIYIKFEDEDRANYGYPEFALELAVKPPCTTEFTVGQRVKTKYNDVGTVTEISHDYVYVLVDGAIRPGGWFPSSLTAYPTPKTTKVKVDAQTTAVVTPTKLEPVLGARVKVNWSTLYTGWNYEGVIEKITWGSYHVRMSNGPKKGEIGAFDKHHLEVLSVPVTQAPTQVQPGGKLIDPSATPLSTAREIARQLALTSFNSRVNIDQVQDELAKKGYKPSDLGNAAGQVFNKGNWKNTGVTVKSTRPGNHSRRITVWELTS